MNIGEILINAAEIYYDYLDKHNLGLSQIEILGYEVGDDLCFYIRGSSNKIKSSTSLLLRVSGDDYTLECESAYYDEFHKCLHISEYEPILENVLKNAKARNLPVTLWTDLKFLVKNVHNFFSAFGENITLPINAKSTTLNILKDASSKVPLGIMTQTDRVIDVEIPYIERLSKEQNDALKMVLTSSLSYVWGPPGTGKTQAVLFEALLHYIKRNKRVAVLASTNNALEQVLMTLIKQFDDLGLERELIMRLGMPTLSFINVYPQCCDPSILKQKNNPNLFDFAKKDTLKSRIKNAFVIGVTLDGFIKRYDSLDLHFSHIFLDECAFAPLIKACALCVDGVALSFFGDHKQLCPVCEMPESAIKAQNLDALVWNRSALFLESFCTQGVQSLLKDEPQFRLTHLSSLNKTHRYGDNLASILDRYIYHIGLKGNGTKMGLFVLDSGAKSEEDDKISQNEIHACVRLCAKFAKEGENFAVITPFKKQCASLAQRINRDNVFTIHSSQGQEFDNVIFSPVSLHYHLTNSNRKQALYALNVAISRTKKNLFIICDYDFWIRQQNQLITSIIKNAQKINL